MSKPSHIAYVVNESKEDDEREAFWRPVGVVWPHKNGNGFDVVISDQISVTGRIVCTERKNKRSGVDDGTTPLTGYQG
jgi:hypothetical protein